MNTPESKEMYLETIYLLHKRGARVKSVDVAATLGFSRPSVSNAVKKLCASGLIYIGKGGELTLTQEGEKLAAATYERHCVITDLLMLTGADKTVAEENACRIEHIITEEMFVEIKNFLDKKRRNL